MKKEILVSVLGTSPAIITETLWYLIYKEKREINAIYVITTTEGRDGREGQEKPSSKLIHYVHKMIEEYGIKSIDFSEENLLVIKDKNGKELRDILSREDNDSAANFIINSIRNIIRENPDSILHCSIAGGRKTMSSYMALALTLLGRKDDKLYHVLAPNELERNRDFYYPPRERVGEYEDKIFLVDIKYPRLGEKYFSIVPEQMSFTEMVDEIMNAIERKSERPDYIDIDERYELVGKSHSFIEAKSKLEKYARSNIVNVLLLVGETGSGKELFARYFAKLRGKDDDKFVAHNFAELRGSDINISRAELFGYVKGAFTGANRDKIGWIESAEGKVLFLDELQDATVDVQVLLNRVLEQREYYRVGDEAEKKNIKDVTFIFAINKNVEQLCNEGKLKRDFYNRIRAYTVNIPSLNERSEDIEDIMQRMFVKLIEGENKSERGEKKEKQIKISEAVLDDLRMRDWSEANIRLLDNIVRNMYINIKLAGKETEIITLKELREVEDLLPPRVEKGLDTNQILEKAGIARKGESIVDLLKGRYRGKFEQFLKEFEIMCYSELAKTGMKQNEISKLLGVSTGAVSNKFKILREKGHRR